MQRYITYIALGLLTLGLVFLYMDLRHLKHENRELHKKMHSRFHNTEEEQSHNDLLSYMGYFQRFSDKLYFAGSNGNWDLADFYLEEIEETAEKLEKGNIEDEGVNLSALISSVLLPQVKKMEETLAKKDVKAFQEQYPLMIGSCNKCHTLAKHPFVVIKQPTSPTHGNQEYTVKH
jgi:hypothetical protein